MGWRPLVKREAFPQEGTHMRWAPVQQALVTGIAPMLTDNFGCGGSWSSLGCGGREAVDGRASHLRLGFVALRWRSSTVAHKASTHATLLQARDVRPAGPPV